MKELYEDKLRHLSEDLLMQSALRELIESEIRWNLPKIDEMNDDIVLGQKYRASEHAKKIIDGAFSKIESYKGQKLINITNKGK